MRGISIALLLAFLLGACMNPPSSPAKATTAVGAETVSIHSNSNPAPTASAAREPSSSGTAGTTPPAPPVRSTCSGSNVQLTWVETSSVYDPRQVGQQERTIVDATGEVHAVRLSNLTLQGRGLTLDVPIGVNATANPCAVVWASGLTNGSARVVAWDSRPLVADRYTQLVDVVRDRFFSFAPDQSLPGCVDGGAGTYRGWAGGQVRDVAYRCAPTRDFQVFLSDTHRVLA